MLRLVQEEKEMTARNKEERALKKIQKLIKQHISQGLTLAWIIGAKFRFYFRDDKGQLKILSAQVVSWQFQKGKLYLDTSSPSISYLLVDKNGVRMVGHSEKKFEGRIEVY
ncbi:hypothetical protein KJ885_03205 [Patescibacteria group bacterium]|nr:hypothetical protein [Patescibacteria group bacterium]